MNESQIFNGALKLATAAERAAFLAERCDGNTKLRSQVEGLLKLHENDPGFLEKPIPAVALTIEQSATEHPGSLIGPYKLLEQVGEGGMGVVYVAEQTEPVRRRVALKIIKPGMDTKQVIARFEAERQALAMMDHPHIAKVLDAGTTDAGRPYFVMELVRGMPFTDYCDKVRLSPRQRLELFVDVCHAIQHAHQKGIIHRDLKPSNILITLYDGKPVVKVIDFGVAKAIGQQLTERTVYTALTQLVGTPLYMSPEQAELSGLDIDTRSDVYSLGVLLYELLTGQTPFDKDRLKSVSFDEMRRMIREDEPPRPSRRFSTLGIQAISTASQHRGVDERRLSKILSGELDWIVMKALEKDRSRRYESASALAADIQRYLSDEPVLACPPTTMYRFQKFSRKHKASITSAAAIAACLLLGTTVSAWQAVRATTAKTQANANAAEAQDKAKEATEQRDEAQKQRDEVKALADKLAVKEEQLERMLYADHIHMAQAAWDSGDVPKMSQLLGQHVPKDDEPDRRGFEWHFLNRLSNIGPLVSIRTPGPVAPQVELRLSPDRTRLIRFTRAIPATVTRNRTTPATPPKLQAWHLQTGEEELAVELDLAANASGRRPELTPDGAYLVLNTGRWGNTGPGEVKVWDTRTGKEVLKLNDVGSSVDVCFSPDNKVLAVPSKNQSLRIWDLQTGQERLTLQGQPKLVPTAVAFSADGKRLAATWNNWDDSTADEIRIWDVQTGEQLKSFQSQANVEQLIFSPDRQRLVTSAEDNDSIKIWEIQTGKDLRTFRWDIEDIDELKFNADGTRLAALGSEENESKEWVSSAKLWNVQTGQEMLSVRADEMQFSPDGKRVALSDSDNNRTKVFDANSGQFMLNVKDAGGVVAFSPDSRRLAIKSGGMRIWDLETGDEINHIKGFDAGFLLAFSQDGKRLIGSTWGATPSVQVWEVGVEQQSAKKIPLPGVRPLYGLSDGPAVISSDFTRIAAISGKTVKLFDAHTGQELRTLSGHDQTVLCVAFSQDGKRLASSDGQHQSNSADGNVAGGKAAGGSVKVWDTETGKELLNIAGLPHNIIRLIFSPDGKKLAGTPGDRSIKVWDARSGGDLYGFGPSPINRIPQMFAFSPDGKCLAWQGTIRDAETGNVLVTLKNAGGNTGAFSSDGKRVVGRIPVGNPVVDRTRAPNQQIAYGVWDTETGELLCTTPGVDVKGLGQLTFSPDGKRLAGGGKIWDAYTGQFLLSLSSDRISQVAFSPDGHRLAVVKDYSNEVTIYDATPLPEKP